MAKEVYGLINFYGDMLLPLDEAHKIQAIMAKYAKGHETIYRSGGEDSIYYIKEMEVPHVRVSAMPKYSTEGLNYNQRGEWVQAIRESKGDDFLSPQAFVNLIKE